MSTLYEVAKFIALVMNKPNNLFIDIYIIILFTISIIKFKFIR